MKTYRSARSRIVICLVPAIVVDRKSTRLNSSHGYISYAVFCLKKKNINLAFARRAAQQPDSLTYLRERLPRHRPIAAYQPAALLRRAPSTDHRLAFMQHAQGHA